MAVGVSGELPQIQNASMWGIGRTVAREHPELRATLVDLGAAPNPLEARELARQISQNGEEDRIALRGKDRYLARLALHASVDPQSLFEAATPAEFAQRIRVMRWAVTPSTERTEAEREEIEI
jgi:hypothetical protein